MSENLIHPGKLCFKILLCLGIYTFFPKMKKLEVKNLQMIFWEEGQEIGSPVPKKRFVKELHK
jgi:hypothetical protein